MRGELSDMSRMALWVAGEAGQVSLARTAESDGLRASLDQHAAVVRDALGGRVTEEVLLSYARGFVEAAVARGWWPPHRRSLLTQDSLLAPGLAGLDEEPLTDKPSLTGKPSPFDGPSLLDLDMDAELDWESLRLAAICHLFLEARGLGI
jgi:hypothetical protein